MKDKKIYKKIGFSYHQVNLIPIQIFLEKEREIYKKTNYKTISWKLGEVLDFLIKTPNFHTVADVKGDKVEIEPQTLIKEEGLYFFQLSKMRVDNIPATKKIGQKRKEIMLNDDEYIGEFTGILYDPELNVALVQNNKYAMSNSDLNEYFNILRENYFLHKSIDNEGTEMVEFSTLIDIEKLKNIEKSKEIRKIRLRGNDTHLAALASDKEVELSKIKSLVESYGHVNFEIIISAKIEKDNKTLNLDPAKELIKEYTKKFTGFTGNSVPDLQITRKENDDSNVESIDFLLPKMSDSKSVKLEPRKSIAPDYLRTIMLELYKKRHSIILNILWKK